MKLYAFKYWNYSKEGIVVAPSLKVAVRLIAEKVRDDSVSLRVEAQGQVEEWVSV